MLPKGPREDLYIAIAEALDHDGEFILADDQDKTDAMFEAVEPVVAALLSQARAEAERSDEEEQGR